MQRRILFALLIVAICTLPALGQWKSWGKYKGHKVYYQRFTRERRLVKVWIKKDRVLGYLAFDCSQRKVKQIDAIKNGNLIGSWDGFHFVAPGTFGEWLYNKACP